MPASVRDRERDPEIGEQRLPLLQQDVVRLEVAMDDALSVRVLQRAGDPHGEAHRLVHG